MQLFGRLNPTLLFSSQIQVNLSFKENPNYLETVAALRLLPHHVQDAVHQLGPLHDSCDSLYDSLVTAYLGVVTLGPVVAGPRLAEHEVVGSEDAAIRA